jgi:SP family sugar:H+ symporter-like MFS transporter
MRSKGLLVWNTVNQIMGAYVTWVDAIALEAIGYKYYAVYMPLVIIQFFLCWRCKSSSIPSSTSLTDADMVETKGYTLEEVALAFDGSSSSLALDVEGTNYQQTEDSDSKDRHDVK